MGVETPGLAVPGPDAPERRVNARACFSVPGGAIEDRALVALAREKRETEALLRNSGGIV